MKADTGRRNIKCAKDYGSTMQTIAIYTYMEYTHHRTFNLFSRIKRIKFFEIDKCRLLTKSRPTKIGKDKKKRFGTEKMNGEIDND